jgi:hypothetical protein
MQCGVKVEKLDSDENFKSDSDDKMASLTNPEQSKQEQLAIDSGVLSFNGHPGTKFPAGLKVLAVDDDALCLRCLEALLKRCNYEGTTLSIVGVVRARFKYR